MKKIHLNDEYDWHNSQDYIEVSDDVAKTIEDYNKNIHAQNEKIRYNGAFYSLDAGDGIESHAVEQPKSPQEIYEQNEKYRELHKAISLLPEVQFRRLTMYYFEGMKLKEIAIKEQVTEMAISKTISKAEKNIKKILEKGV